MKTTLSTISQGFREFGIAAMVLAGTCALSAADQPASPGTAPAAPVAQAAPVPPRSVQAAPSYSYAVTEVVKMTDAKVNPDVVKDFIRVSTAPFQPTAAEVIALKQRGISDDLIQTMLQRDAQLQANSPTGPAQQPPVPSYPAPSVPMVQPAPTYSPQYAAQPATVYYDQSVVDYSSSYYYPYYYPSFGIGYWGWGWPGYGYRYGWYHRPFYYGGYHGGGHPWPINHGGFGGHPGGWNGGHGPVGGQHFVGGRPGGGFSGGHSAGGGHRGR